jgi:pimeloyl-ACP methyl ester carboxylesterase
VECNLQMPVAADLYYHIYEGGQEGQRPPVILLHGAGGTHLYWPSDIRRLAGYRMFALDLPGHGRSGGRGQQSIAAYAGAIIDWMDAIGLHSAVFVGHSMGSAIALTLALDFPDRVLGLGLVGSGARLKVNPALLEIAASETTFQTVIDLVVSWSFSSSVPAELVGLASKRMAETRPSVLYGDFQACNVFDVTSRLGEIQVPTLVICGRDDRMTPLRHAQYLVDNIPGARLAAIPDAGHMVMLEQPQAVAKTLGEFLAAVSY